MPGAKFAGRFPNASREALVPDERRIASRTVKPFPGVCCPREKVSFVYQGTGGPLVHYSGGLGVLLDANAIGMHG